MNIKNNAEGHFEETNNNRRIIYVCINIYAYSANNAF